MTGGHQSLRCWFLVGILTDLGKLLMVVATMLLICVNVNC